VGTRIVYDEKERRDLEPGMLLEEYVEGEVISLEVVGDGRNFAVIKETRVHIDGTYDCHMGFCKSSGDGHIYRFKIS
jgi:pyrrolysine biosynthesis protein PylC